MTFQFHTFIVRGHRIAHPVRFQSSRVLESTGVPMLEGCSLAPGRPGVCFGLCRSGPSPHAPANPCSGEPPMHDGRLTPPPKTPHRAPARGVNRVIAAVLGLALLVAGLPSSVAGVVTIQEAPLAAQARSLTLPVQQGKDGTALSPRQQRALQLEDWYRLRSVGSLDIDPDGRWVSYTVDHPVEETNDDRTETWIARTDGTTPPERVLHQGEDVSNPGWESDGRLRYRHGEQTWLINPGSPGATPEALTHPDQPGVTSPDGRWRARASDVPRVARDTPNFSEFERRHEARFRGEAFDWYPFKRDGEDFPLEDPSQIPAKEVFLESLTDDSDPVQLTDLGLEAGSLEWTPDGRAILFSANVDLRDELLYGTSDLFMVTVDGEVTRLTDDEYSYSGARISPDGRSIAYVRSYGTDMIIEEKLDHGGPRDLFIHPLDGGAPRNLTADWDLEAGSPMWSPDGMHLYFTTGIGGATHLFRVAARGGSVEQVTTGDRRIGNLRIDRDFRRMTYTVGEFDRPSDVWVADITGGNEQRISDVHADFLEEVTLATHPSIAVHWNSYDGTPIEGFLIFPYDYDPQAGTYPLIIMNHGGPHSASGYGFNFKNSFFAASGYFVFLPNFRASTGYGEAFKWGTWGGWGNNDGEDVLSGVDFLVEAYPIDRNRVGTTGHSYGGILTNWLITRYPDRFRAAVSGAGESNWTSNFAMSDVARTKETEFFGRPWEPRAQEIMIRQSAYLNSLGVQAPTLFVHGDVDYRVPLSGAIQLYTSLKKQGVPSKMIIYENTAHGIRGHWNNIHRIMHELLWWDTYLMPETLSTDSDAG